MRQAEAEQRELAQSDEHKALAAAAAEKEAKEEAEGRETETKAVLEFVEKKDFAAARPQGADGGGPRGHASPGGGGRAAVRGEELRNQPLIEARLRVTMGVSYSCLGDAKTRG